ncbi:monovalent cation/H(+) antiporter subunit G [Bacillaceae bacterium SIJ1]|nr:monovalent cation/H(+) antiporter subunit G [Litoribacterium kuwaitense]
MSEILVSVLILIGCFFLFSGSLGMLRFPDIYNRLHAATKSATLGVIGVLLGSFIYFLAIEGIMSGKLLIGIIFVTLTAPVSAHMIGRSAYLTHIPLSRNSIHNALHSDVEKKQAKEKKRG